MQSTPTQTKSRPAMSQGILFGVIVGVILIIYLLVSYIAYIPTLTLILGIITFLVELFLYAFAGFRASAITGRTGTGAMAGLFTGLVGGLIGAVVSIILLFVYLDATRLRLLSVATSQVARQLYTNTFVISTGIIGALLGLGLAIGYGAAAGAIGGVIGKRRAPQVQLYQEGMYQGMPPAQGPYQGVPPQGPYQQGPYSEMPPQGPYSGVPPTQDQYQQDTSYPQNPYQSAPPTQNPPPPDNYPGNYQ